MLRVGLDLTPTTTGTTGVARYCSSLAATLPAEGVEVRGFAIGRGRHLPPVGTRRVRLPLRAAQASWRLTGAPRAEWLVGPVDLVHSTDLVPPATRRPLVMTVHDVAAVTHPHLHPPAATALQRAAVAATHRASLVLADSQATADALAALGGGVDRLVVVPLGLTGLPAPTTAHVPAQPFLLAVGELAARKSLDVLLAALATLPPPLRLVLAGPLGYRGGDVLAEIDRLGLAHRVSVLGPVGDATLAGLFSSAQLLCFTSAAEGFGLPVLEAMGSGLPVVASDLAVTRELAGDAAVFFPAGDAAELAGAVSGLLAAPARREAMRQRGRERAALFTWQRTAQLTAAAYREALA